LNLLAFDTSTETLFVAVRHDGASQPALLQHTGPGGAQASATLLPAIHELLARAGLRLADLDAIVFGRGPGSFTGLRTACSVAQGLSFGSSVPVLAVDTLLAVAEEAYHQQGAQQIVALLDARMDEVYSACYLREGAGWRQQGEFALGRPESVTVPPGFALAGNAFAAYGDRLPAAAAHLTAMPTATALLRLAPALLAAGQGGPAAGAIPLYIRDKVAQTTQERAASRAASPNHP
jgi:tRNA threonylcarbamoyladenosine biosynthesis protein TsaB